MSHNRHEDERWMRRALGLARKGEGLTRPNPPVGAVLVRNGHVIGEGYHRMAGGPHAEIEALRKAGSKARGSTLYVTLEPCSTWGRTPPCTDAILAAGVARVVVAVRDPNPAHAGRGLALLRRKGLKTDEGFCHDEAQALIAPFAKWIRSGVPYLTLKLGMSLDGRIADRHGRSRWITGPLARVVVQALRRRADAIMVGARTVIADNPSLLPRPGMGRKPWRVVIAGREKISPRARVLSDRTLVFRSRNGKVSLRRAMKTLARQGILHVVCEGGGELAASLIKARLVDEIWLFMAPAVLGGESVNAVAGTGWPLAKAPRFKLFSVENVGDDLLIRARPA